MEAPKAKHGKIPPRKSRARHDKDEKECVLKVWRLTDSNPSRYLHVQ
jgi:hypothetical protein